MNDRHAQGRGYDTPCHVVGGTLQHQGPGSQNDGDTVGRTESAISRRKCTPPDLEVLLRQYNSHGITSWDDIIERLQKENPPFHIKRATLGKYLRECNLGTSRRNKMDIDKIQQIIICELNQSRSRNCGVEAVWKTLKSNGHHIKKDLVRQVMKEFSPDRFLRQRPNPTTSRVSDVSPERPRHTRSEPPMSFGEFGTDFINRELFAPARPSSAPFHLAPVAIELLVQEQVITLPPRPDCDTLQLEPEVYENMDSRMDYTFASGTSDPGLTHEPDPSNIDNTSSAVMSEQDTMRRAEVPYLPPVVNSMSNEDVSGPQDGVFETESILASHDSSLGDTLYEKLPPCAPPPGVFKALAGATDEEKVSQIIRLQLQNTVRELLEQLDMWIAVPLQDVNLETAGSYSFPTLATSEVSVHAEHISQNRADTESKRYVPDYGVPEDQVTKDALFFALALQRILSEGKSSVRILEVSDHLWEINGRLQDIGMTKPLLAATSLTHLRVLKIVAKAFGRATWVLRELQKCAACCVSYLDRGDDDAAFDRAVRMAAAASSCLMSTDSTGYAFNRAVYLHYRSLTEVFVNKDKELGDDLFRESLELFGQALDSNHGDSTTYVQEILRTISRLDVYSDSVFMLVDMFKKHLPMSTLATDPTLACVFLDVVGAGDVDWEDVSPEVIVHIIRRINTGIGCLRSRQHLRTSRVQLALARVLRPLRRLGDVMGFSQESQSDAVREEMELGLRIAKFGEREALSRLNYVLEVYVRIQLEASPPRWKDASSMICRVWELFQSFPATDLLRETPLSVSGWFTMDLEETQSQEALSAALDLINYFRPFLASTNNARIFSALLNIMRATSHLQRVRGELKAALGTAREALSLSRTFRSRNNLYSEFWTSDDHLMVQADHIRCLLDSSADDASRCLREALVCRPTEFDDMWELCRFGILYALDPARTPVDLRHDKTVSWVEPCHSLENRTPCWLRQNSRGVNMRKHDERAWGLLLHAVISISVSPERALESARKSRILMGEYHSALGRQNGVGPSVFASVLGHEYVLAVVLGEVDRGKTALEDTILRYRSILDTEPHMALLPLMILLEILLMLSHKVTPLHHVIPSLQAWKKSIYDGSTAFFDKLVELLRDLPHYIHRNGALVPQPSTITSNFHQAQITQL